jgi:hypothetical protein
MAGMVSTGTPNLTCRDMQAKLTDQQIAETIRSGRSGRSTVRLVSGLRSDAPDLLASFPNGRRVLP